MARSGGARSGVDRIGWTVAWHPSSLRKVWNTTTQRRRVFFKRVLGIMKGMPKHISVSQISMHSKCGEQFRRRYEEGEICPPGFAALTGSGVHAGAAHAMEWKREHGGNVSPDDVRDVAVAGLDERFGADGAMLTSEETDQGVAASLGAARDRTAALAHFWGCVVQPEYNAPQWVEERWEFGLPNGQTLLGITDLATPGLVTDWKTGRRKLSQREADTSLQLTAYAIAYRRRYGVMPNVRLDCLTSRKQTTRTVLNASRGMTHVEQFAARLRAFTKSVASGSFVPCLPTEWFCSEKWCGYAKTCPYYIPDLEEKDDD